MTVDIIPPVVMTAIWGFVGICGPILVQLLKPKSENKGIAQLCLMLTGFCCWLFWGLCYLSQLNPLIGPKLAQHTLFAMAREWSGCAWEDEP